MTTHEIKESLRKLYVDVLRLNKSPNDIPDSDLVAQLGIDSVTSLELLVWVENTFKIQIDDGDLSAELVDSLDHLAAYVQSKQVASCTGEASRG